MSVSAPAAPTPPPVATRVAANSAKAGASCRHCGAALIDARMRETGFCCSGCSYVFRLVHEHGLDGYYRIKDDVTTPADAAVFQPRDYAWLETLQRTAESTLTSGPNSSASPELTLDIQGISCAGCVWLIERIFQQRPGARDIFVNAQYGSMRLRWIPGEFSAADFARKIQAFGYLAGPPGEAVEEPESRALVKRIGLCAAFAMNVMLFSLPTYFGMEHTYEWAGLFGVLNVAFGTLSLLVGGLYFLSRAVQALRERVLHIDLPIAIGIVGAYAGSLYGWLVGEERLVYFDFVSAFILLMLVGRWAQVSAVERNRRRLLSQQPKPQRVRILGPDATRAAVEVTPEALRVGQTLLLGSGQTVPVESRLESEPGTFSLASINGEAEPRIFCAGQRVPAGAVNVGRSELRLSALQLWSDSLLAQLLQPGENESARHRLLELIVKGYLIGIFAIAAGSGLFWWFTTGDALRTGSVITAVLVVSCPCAIALAFPLADEMATVALRRRGVFIRRAELWTKLARVRKLVFDKTGTLTLETPVLTNPQTLASLDPAARSALHALVHDNPHPVSQCILENLLALGPVVETVGASVGPSAAVRETIGWGVERGPWALGRPGWRTDAAIQRAGSVDSDGVQDTEFTHAGEQIACFRFVDTARPDARVELANLQRRGLEAYILSGDRSSKVATLAGELGLPAANVRGELSPQAKADWLNAHAPDNAMMLGDGANDSLAFDRALCRGTPVIHRGVLERKADFYYLGRGIGGLRALFEVDAVRRRTQLVILTFSVAYNLLAVGLAAAGYMNPLLAAILMPVNSLATLLIVTTGMRGCARG